MVDQIRSYPYIIIVLIIASDPAILDATFQSFDMKIATVNVLKIANNLHINALIKLLWTESLPVVRPADDRFMIRSPMNIVATLEMKSLPTSDKAVEMDPFENFSDVANVTLPAMKRHIKALTADRAGVS